MERCTGAVGWSELGVPLSSGGTTATYGSTKMVALDQRCPRCFETALDLGAAESSSAILVASIRDPDTGMTTYGGYRRTSSWHPARLRLIQPDPVSPIVIDAFNGNVVYVPAGVVERIGIIDPTFSHATGHRLRLASQEERRSCAAGPGHLRIVSPQSTGCPRSSLGLRSQGCAVA